MSKDALLPRELVEAFLAEAGDHVAAAEAALLTVERSPLDGDAVEAAFRALHSIKGSAGPLGFAHLRDLAHALEDVLAALRERRLVPDRILVGSLLAGLDGVRALLAAAAGTPSDPVRHRTLIAELAAIAATAAAAAPVLAATATDPLDEARRLCTQALDDEGVQRLAHLLARLPGRSPDPSAVTIAEEILATWQETVPATGLSEVVRDWIAGRLAALAACAAPPAPATGREVRSAGDTQTLRVAAERIDDLLRLAGDLLEFRDRLGRLPGRLRRLPAAADEARDLRRMCDELSRTTDALRQAVLEIRRLPAEVLLPRLRRVLRDACAATGKDAALTADGLEIEVDKTLIELLDAQLPHLVRNAIDHGIETPSARAAAGKPSSGILDVHVVIAGNHVQVDLADDGAGLDLARLRARGEAMGLLAPGQAASDEELAELIFAAGLSTAERVSELSGRGVGMDAVRRAVESAGGRIGVESRAGQGTRFSILLPAAVTTRILAGYLVRVGGTRAVLPLDRVRETFRPDPSTLAGTGPGTRGVLRHGHVLPVLDLGATLGLAGGGGVMVAATCRRRTVALAVDDVLGVQQVVVRPLDGLPDLGGLYSGAALLGDGALALVLEPDALIDTRSCHA